MATKSNAHEITITRIYNAPRQVVWDAWVDPVQVAQWWGPRGFSITSIAKDVRTGGYWHYTMHGPDGTDYPNRTTYLEVVPGARLVYDHGANETQPALFRVTAEFTDVGKTKTKLTMRMAVASAEALAHIRVAIKAANGNTTWDRLGEYLDESVHGKQRFIINRSVAAPRDVVYRMWTDPQHLAAWSGPTGSTIEFLRFDMRVGGGAHYRMTTGDDALYAKTEYVELVKPERIVYKQWFADEAGQIARHPMAPLWPECMLTVVEFAEEGDGQTRITITWEPIGDVSPESIAIFVGARAGMSGGWTGSLDQLEAYLPTTMP